MTLGVWQGTAINDLGDVVPRARIEVRRQSDDVLVALYGDRDGTVPIGNPVIADHNGFARFFASSSAYKVTVSSGSESTVFTYLPIASGGGVDTTDAFKSTTTQETLLEDEDLLPFFSSAGDLRLTTWQTFRLSFPFDHGAPEVLLPSDTFSEGGQSTSFTFPTITFADGVTETCRWLFALPDDYDPANGLRCDILYIGTSGAGDVDFGIQCQYLNTSFAGGTYVYNTGLSISNTVVSKATIDITDDEIGFSGDDAPFDPIRLTLARVGGDDTNTGVVHVLAVLVYSPPQPAVLDLAHGAFNLSGQDLMLLANELVVEFGSFSLTGQDIELTGPSGFSATFDLTAGDYASTYQGYSDGSFLPSFGTISGEPISGHPLITFIADDAGAGGLSFEGDARAFLFGTTIYVESDPYPLDVNWTYDSESDRTNGEWTTGAPDLDTTVYTITIE